MRNLSSQFITPVVGLKGGESIYSKEFTNSYLGATGYDCEYGKCFFLHYSSDVSTTLRNKLTSHPKFKETYTPKEGEVMFVFSIPDDLVEKVVKPFLDGKYSAIDRDYVEQHFPDDPTKDIYPNRLVLDKSPRFIQYWADKGVDIPEGAEVWSRPTKTKEVYGYSIESEGQSPIGAE